MVTRVHIERGTNNGSGLRGSTRANVQQDLPCATMEEDSLPCHRNSVHDHLLQYKLRMGASCP
jgi:hypothetical protein